MIMRPSPPIDPDVLREVTALMNSEADLETSLARMRALGLNKIECITILRDHAGIDLREGKKIVHFSSAWKDRLEADNAFHEAAHQAVLKEGWTEDSVNAEHPAQATH